MQIITVNIPKSYVEKMAELTGQEALFPSRSELIRVAIREYLALQIKKVEMLHKEQTSETPSVIVNKGEDFELISIPLEADTRVGVKNVPYKTYKVVQKSKAESSSGSES